MAPACSPSEGTDRAEEDSVYAAIRQQISEGGKHGPGGRFDKRVTRKWLSCFGCASRAWESCTAGQTLAALYMPGHYPLLVHAGTMERGVLGAAAIAAQARRPSPLRSHARTHARTRIRACTRPSAPAHTLSQRSCHTHYHAQSLLSTCVRLSASRATPRFLPRTSRPDDGAVGRDAVIEGTPWYYEYSRSLGPQRALCSGTSTTQTTGSTTAASSA